MFVCISAPKSPMSKNFRWTFVRCQKTFVGLLLDVKQLLLDFCWMSKNFRWTAADVRDQVLNLQGRHRGNDFLEEEGEPLVERDRPVSVLIHLGERLLSLLRQLERGGQSETLLGGSCDRDHGRELSARHLAVPVRVSCLEAFPGEEVDLLVALRGCVQGLLAVSDKLVFVLLVESSGQILLDLVVLVGKAEPLIEGDGAVPVLVDGLEHVSWASLPPVKAKLLWKSSRSGDHSSELLLGHLPVKVSICGDKSSEENVVELDVAVVGLVLHRALHPVDELVLARDVHGEVFLLPGNRGLCVL